MSEPKKKPAYKKKIITSIQDNEINRAIFSSAFPTKSASDTSIPTRKFTSSQKTNLRDSFKKTFLPLLIDVIELRQLVQNNKLKDNTLKKTKTPKEILERLEHLQNEIEESKKWCEGVILQISKGIDEAKAVLEGSTFSHQEHPPVKKSLLKKLLGL